LIHLMSGTQSVVKNPEKAKASEARFIIPPFVDYEVRRGLMINPFPKRMKAYDTIGSNCTLGETARDEWVRAAKIYLELYTKRFTVKDADILIAAFCMENGYALVTANIKDFENIDGLQLVNWLE